QDMLMHWGTLGPQALGIDRTLWIGTPYSSKWMRHVTGAPRPDCAPTLVGVFNDHARYAAMAAEDRARLRYILVSHDNDGVTKFGADLVTSRPRCAGPRPPPGPGGRWGQLSRGPTRDALATRHHLPADPHRHEERPGTRRLPGLGARLPARPRSVHPRHLRSPGFG